MSKNDTTTEATTSSVDTSGLVHMNPNHANIGHLVFFAAHQGNREGVPYDALVNKAREEGIAYDGIIQNLDEEGEVNVAHPSDALYFADDWAGCYTSWNGYLPMPRFGSNAFSFAVRELAGPRGYVDSDEWRDARGRNKARVSYEVECITPKREYKLVRRLRGFHVESQRYDTWTEDLFRLSYVPPKGELKTWSDRFVRGAWGQLEEEETPADVSELSDFFEVTPYSSAVLADPDALAYVVSQLTRAMHTQCTTVDHHGIRAVIRNAVRRFGGVRFGGSSGGTYFIPNFSGNNRYLNVLEPFANLVNWFGDETVKTDEQQLVRPDMAEQMEGDISMASIQQPRSVDRTTFRVLGFVDDEETMQFIMQDVSNKVSNMTADYFDKVVAAVRQTDDENLPRAIERLVREKSTLERRLGEFRSLVGDSIASTVTVAPRVTEALNPRFANIRSTNEREEARLRSLLTLSVDNSESATGA